MGVGGPRAPPRAAGDGASPRCARSSASSLTMRSEPVALDQVALPEPRPIPEAVRAAAGEVLDGADDRIRHAAGRSYPDLVRLRTGRLEHAPDAVLRPRGRRRRRGGARRLRSGRGRGRARSAAGRASWAGSRRSRTGTRRSSRSTSPAALGRARLALADRAPGPGPDAGRRPRRRSARSGATLGHFPQSFEEATIGGFAATRSAGQASSGYGRFDEMVTALELAAPGRPAANARRFRTPPPGRRCASWSWARRGRSA